MTTIKHETQTATDVLKGFFKLSEKVAIIIPSTTDATITVNTDEWKDSAMELLSELFGGATAYKAQGGWMSDEHGLIKEDVTVVYANAEAVTGEHMEEIVTFAERMKAALQQEAIAVEYNGALHFI